MTKLVIVRYMPLTDVIYNKFYLDLVAQLSVSVEYWDVTTLFFKNASYLQADDNICKVHIIKSYAELTNKIKAENIETTLFFPMMTVEGRVRKLYKIFTKYNCHLMMIGRNVFPFPPYNNSTKSIFKKLASLTPKRIINKLNSILLQKEIFAGKIIPFQVVFLGGSCGWMGVGTHNMDTLSKARSVINLNSEDYDRACQIKCTNTPATIDGQYILFLDEYLPLHPDTVMFDLGNVDPDRYYQQLNNYFDKVEAQFGIPVVIAAHPKAQKYRENDYFNGRIVRFGQSAQLCKDAQFVLAHDSTSINFAICFDKPLHLITSREIEKIIDIVHIDVLHFAKVIGCNWQYFDDLNAEINIATIDPTKYEAYKYNFQTSKETQKQKSCDIFINYLKDNI